MPQGVSERARVMAPKEIEKKKKNLPARQQQEQHPIKGHLQGRIYGMTLLTTTSRAGKEIRKEEEHEAERDGAGQLVSVRR